MIACGHVAHAGLHAFRYKAGEVLFHEGDMAQRNCYVVTQGVLNVAKRGVEGVRAAIDAGRPDPARRWPEIIARSVEKHSPLSPTDDTLIVELFCVNAGATR